MSKKFFGTDGIRGRVGVEPMTAPTVLKLGWAAGKVLASQGNREVLIGKDTRISGYLFESALEAGLSSAGLNARMLGPMPTPAVAYLTRTFRAAAGIVISASHNPHYDNGVKFFGSDGYKLDDDTEHAIEEMLGQPLTTVESEDLGRAERIEDAGGRYIEYCKSTFPSGMRLDGLKLVVDAANGAGYDIARRVFEELGATVISQGASPNGLNINDNCGATAPDSLRAHVLLERADMGIALDGDGDRLIMVDERGDIVDGDEILFVLAKAAHASGQLNGGGVVGTLMSNLGLEHAFRDMSVPFKRAKVGDRHVLEMMKANNWRIGGESSGHLITLDHSTTGDGIIAALQVLAYVVESGERLTDLKNGMMRYPQTLVNVPMGERINLDESSSVQEALRSAESDLGDTGRVLLRPSGTEPVVRVMVEGRVANQVESICHQVADAVRLAVA